MKEHLLGYEVDVASPPPLVDELFTAVTRTSPAPPRCLWLACLNPHSYAVAKHDALFAAALRGATWLIPDGAGILLASRLLGGRMRERVTGSDIFQLMHEPMNAAGGMSVFFLGSTKENLGNICRKMQVEFPNISIAGTYSPPFKPEYTPVELEEMIAAINAVQPDVLWVGMTAPKQEKWIFANRDKLDVRFAAAVGAVFDFYTGRVQRSHPVFQKLGLEWLPRLVQQPKRLWRRMFVSAPVFLLDVLKARVSRGRAPKA